MNPCMSLYTGRRLDVVDPQTDQIHIVDIARGLSREGRFANQTDDFYSVAQHSLLVEEILGRLPHASRMLRLCGLMHDAHEFVTRDIPTPVAQALNRLAPGALDAVKGRIQLAIDTRWGLHLDADDKRALALADRKALLVEKQDLRIDPLVQWPDLVGLGRPAVPLLVPMTREQAYAAFLERWLALWGDA